MKKMKFGKVTGDVAAGNALGRQLGYPTANIYGVEGLEAPDGVYAVSVRIGDQETALQGMANLGRRPTLGDDAGRRVLEFHLFGFDGDIYGRKVTVSLCEYIREEKAFAGTDELKKQLAVDERTIKDYFKTNK